MMFIKASVMCLCEGEEVEPNPTPDSVTNTQHTPPTSTPSPMLTDGTEELKVRCLDGGIRRARRRLRVV